jgi:DNA-binding PadR family transcriptional regulator
VLGRGKRLFDDGLETQSRRDGKMVLYALTPAGHALLVSVLDVEQAPVP